jgi:LAS superfamily LD-carboxypeptidase LdcB
MDVAGTARLEDLVLGRAPELMVEFGPTRVCVHREVVAALRAMVDAAASERLALTVASGFRSFDRQLAIWNQKARGERPLLDASERALDPHALTPEQRLFAILRWSALPGGSRHHWGTDLDVFDASVLPKGAAPRLERNEAAPDGIFARLHGWLDDHAHRFGFFRPYDRDRGGVSPEPWHLSYAPIARACEAAHSRELLETAVIGADLELKDEVLRNLDTIYDRYVKGVSTAPVV